MSIDRSFLQLADALDTAQTSLRETPLQSTTRNLFVHYLLSLSGITEQPCFHKFQET
jgi:hypothetical protein